MTAIFTGLGSGLARSSAATLGSAGILGAGQLGRGGENVAVNAANGNLIISRQDEFLVGRGLDLGISRTYNSRGIVADTGGAGAFTASDGDNNDNWQMGTTRRLFIDTANGKVWRQTADGSLVTYVGSGNSYSAKDGEGRDDTLVKIGADWVWTDGATRVTEKYSVSYSDPNVYRIAEQTDPSGNTINFRYLAASDRISRVTTSQHGSGNTSTGIPEQSYIEYIWQNNVIVGVTTAYTDYGDPSTAADDTNKTLTRTWYDYNNGKLERVRTDLTPDDNERPTLSQSYWTQYGYDADGRVNLITQRDGSRLEVGYDAAGRVSFLRQVVSAGVDERVTSFTYGTGFTNVTGPTGHNMRLEYDGDGNLTRTISDPATADGTRQIVTYSYVNGELSQVTDALNNSTFYHYDAAGNIIEVEKADGTKINRTYDTNGNVVREVTTGSHTYGDSTVQVRRFAYDAAGRLRFEISPEGNVSEYRYGSSGELKFTIEYPENAHPAVWALVTEDQMVEWAATIADPTTRKFTAYIYDSRGNLYSERSHGIANATVTTGNDGSYAEQTSRTNYAYDQAGRLLSRTRGVDGTESFLYDAMGRLIGSTNSSGGTTSILFDDVNTKTTIRTAGNDITINTYNTAGELLNSFTNGAWDIAGTVQHQYDNNHRIRLTIDQTGNRTYYAYDNLGRKIGEIIHFTNGTADNADDDTGSLTEYRYDLNNRLIATVARYLPVSSAQLAALAASNTAIDIAAVQPGTHIQRDTWNWTVYDSMDRVVQSIDATGNVISFDYDESGRLIRTTSHATSISVLSYRWTPPTERVAVAAHEDDRIARNFYNRDGLLIGTLDGEGYLTQIKYDAAGQKIEEIAMLVRTASEFWVAGSFSQLRASAAPNSTANRRNRYVYNGQGQLAFTVDNAQQVIGYTYNVSGRLVSTTAYAVAITGTDFTFDAVKAAVIVSADDRITRLTYDAAGQIASRAVSGGAITYYTYDNRGNVIKEQVGPESDGRVTRFYYTSIGQLRFTIDAKGHARRFEYDAAGRKIREVIWNDPITVDDNTSITEVNGLVSGGWIDTKYVYDEAGQLISTYDGEGYRTFNVYFANGLLSDTYSAYGTADESRTRFDYDAAGRLTRQISYNHNGAISGTINYAYDGFGNQISVTDQRSKTTTFEYDAVGRVIKTTDALGGVTQYEYNAFGDVTKSIDAKGHTATFAFDNLGRNSSTTNAAGTTQTYGYNRFGEVENTSRTGPVQTYTGTATTSYTYDKQGRVLTSTDALGVITSYQYSIYGEVLSVTRAGATTSFTYDILGRLEKTTDALGFFETYTYDARGNRLTVTAKSQDDTLSAGGTTTYTYDKRGLVTSETLLIDYVNAFDEHFSQLVRNTYSYDGRGNRISMVEAAGLAEARVTSWEYDNNNRVVRTIHPSFQGHTPVSIQAYDTSGNLIQSIDPAGKRKVYYYDDLNRLAAEISATGTYTAYEYDAMSNVSRIRVYETPVAIPAYGGAHTSTTPPSGRFRETFFTHDAMNRMVTSVVANVTTGEFDGTNWVSSHGDLATQYQYDLDGNVVTVIDPNGDATWAWYDALGRKTMQVDPEGYRTDWTYNGDGNVLSETRYANRSSRIPGNAPPPATHPLVTTNPGEDRVTTYSYDKVGNRRTESRSGVEVHNGVGGTTTVTSFVLYTYNGLGQVTRKTEATGDVIDYHYDTGGRLRTEIRDVEGDHVDGDRVDPSARPQIDYSYDGLGNLTQTIAAGSSNTAARITTYGYSGGHLVWMADAETRDSDDKNGKITHYEYDVAGRLVTEFYERFDSAGTLVKDANGTTIVHEATQYAYDAAGRVTQQYRASRGHTQGAWVDVGPRTYTDYNAYGDVYRTSVSLSNVGANERNWQQKTWHDNAGRIVATSSGDGVWKLFGYDKNGNQTIAVTSAGADLTGMTPDQAFALVGQSNVNASYTRYDRRNMATIVTEADRQLAINGAAETLVTQRSYNAFGEVASETNALGATVTYSYNTMGKLTRTESPAVSITDESGSSFWVKPSEDYYYDISGRLVATRDANGTYAKTGTNAASATSKQAHTGNLTRMTLLAGSGYGGSQALVTRQINADGGTVETKYDIHGDARLVTDELGFKTEQTFDKMGRLIQRTALRAANTSTDDFTDYYAYDGLGQQIRHWDSFRGSGDAQITDYDLQGRVVHSRAFGGDTTTVQYTWDGALTTTGLGTFGGWIERTTMANTLYSEDKTDIFGRSVSERDLGGNINSFTYDAAGRVASSLLNGMTTAFTWLNSGHLAQMAIGSPNAGSRVFDWTRNTASYSYDAVGNRLTEHLLEEVGDYTRGGFNRGNASEPEYTPASYTQTATTLKNATATYDALGRLKTASWATVSSTPAASITNEYDAAGNIRVTKANYARLSTSGSSFSNSRDYWFLYDSMNRVVVNEGHFINGNITATNAMYDNASGKESGEEITYNVGGQRVSATSGTIEEDIIYGERHTAADPDYELFHYFDYKKEIYRYDAAGRLSSTERASSLSATSGTVRSRYGYDGAGRQTSQTDYARNGTTVIFNRTATFNTKGQLEKDTSSTLKSDGKTHSSTTHYYLTDKTSGQYLLGAVGSSRSTTSVSGTSGTTTSETVNSYYWREGALQSRITYKPDTSQNTSYNTIFTYNGLGQLEKADINDGKQRDATFANDELGQVIQRDETPPTGLAGQSGAPKEVWYRFNGRQLGYTGNNGTNDMSMDASIKDRQEITQPDQQGTFRNNKQSGISYADFAQSYDPINSFNQGSAGGSYTVQQGDTLQSIAQGLYGDSSLWYKIAEINGLGTASGLIEGQVLTLPTGVIKSRHNAGTLKPYNPADTLGDLTPDASPKPKKKKCGALGAILIAVVALAVTAIVTAGIGAIATGATFSSSLSAVMGGTLATLTGTAGAIGAATVGAAVGSAVSQAVGVATKIQEKFSWKAVGMAAIGAGIGAGLGGSGMFGKVTDSGFQSGTLGIQSQLVDTALRGATTSALTQGIGRATGLQSNFSWAGVAAAGVGAAVGHMAAARLDGSKLGKALGEFGSGVAVNTASTLANAATRSAIEGSSFERNVIAAIPDVIGQALGGALAGAIGQVFSGGSRHQYDVVTAQNSEPLIGAPVGITIDPVTVTAPTAGEQAEAAVAAVSAAPISPGEPPETIGEPIVVTGSRRAYRANVSLEGTLVSLSRYVQGLVGLTGDAWNEQVHKLAVLSFGGVDEEGQQYINTDPNRQFDIAMAMADTVFSENAMTWGGRTKILENFKAAALAVPDAAIGFTALAKISEHRMDGLSAEISADLAKSAMGLGESYIEIGAYVNPILAVVDVGIDYNKGEVSGWQLAMALLPGRIPTTRRVPVERAFISGDPGVLIAKARAAARGDLAALGEINAAKALRAEGINVHFQATASELGIKGVRTPDFLVGGNPRTGVGGIGYDVLTPTTKNAGRIAGMIGTKLSQADRVIINLDRTNVTSSDLSNIIGRVNGIPGLSRPLQEAIIVQNGRVIIRHTR